MKARSNNILVYIILPILLLGTGCATLLEQADHLFKSKGFAIAEDKLERALAKDSANIDLALNLVDAYLKNNKFEEAEDLYAQIIENPKAEAVQKLRYAEQLMDAGKYEQVKTILDILNAEIPGNPQVNDLTQSMDEVEEFLNSMVELENYFKNDGAFEVTNLTINSSESDFSPAFRNDQLVFASARDKVSYVTYLHAWDNQPFTSIYYSRNNEDGFTDPKLFEPHLQSKFHDGVVTFSKDGQQMYFTQNDMNELKDRRKQGLPLNLKISRSDYVNSHWTEPVGFQYNNPNYNCAHPSLSADGQRLYFSSDMPANVYEGHPSETFGGMDIYVCEKLNAGWGPPQNLGPEVNSKKDEVFPFIHTDGSLFFASNGHVGFGGLDLFHATVENNQGSLRKNLGSPVNSGNDDFGIIVYEDGTSGYFCSDRPGGKGHDDIYAFKGYRLPVQLEVMVVDGSNGEPIENAMVELTRNKSAPTFLTTDSMGLVQKTIFQMSGFSIQASKDGYQDLSTVLKTSDYAIDSIPLIKLALDKVIDITDHCDIFKEIDKYLLDEIPMNKIPRLKIASLLNDCVVEIGDQYYSRSDIKLKKVIPGSIEVNGKVMDCNNSQPIPGVKIFARQIDRLTNEFEDNTILKSFTCADGTYSMDLIPDVKYVLSTLKIGKASYLDTMISHSSTPTLLNDIYLCDEEDGPNLEIVFTDINLKDILFDLNDDKIRLDAAKELDKIVKEMIKHPGLIIELGAHTDSRGDDAYNLDLSDRRAKSSAEYIISQGISRSRISGKGYGESELKNHCENGVKCSEEEHQQNRRTEFKIIGM